MPQIIPLLTLTLVCTWQDNHFMVAMENPDTTQIFTTQNMIFSVTYCLELHVPIPFYYQYTLFTN